MLRDCDGEPEAIVIATGSEVALAMEAAESLGERRIRVVSMPSCDRFDAQDESYRDSILPPAVKNRVAVEAGVGIGWRRYTGDGGAIVSIETFGESAPAEDVFKHLGMTTSRVIETIENFFN